MKVGEVKNSGISQESMMHILIFCRFSDCCFFSGVLYYDGFFEVL